MSLRLIIMLNGLKYRISLPVVDIYVCPTVIMVAVNNKELRCN
jgi:hypothetical protein